MVFGIGAVAIMFAILFGILKSGAQTTTSGEITKVKTILQIPTPSPLFYISATQASEQGKYAVNWNEPLADPQVRVRLAKLAVDGAAIIDEVDKVANLRRHYNIVSKSPVALREEFHRHFKTNMDSSTESLILTFEDPDREYAFKVSNELLLYIDRWLSSIIAEKLEEEIRQLDAMYANPALIHIHPEIQALRALIIQAKESPRKTCTVIEIETTTLPASMNTNRYTLMAIAGVFSALFFAFFLAAGLESLDRIRRDPETVARFKALSSRKKKS